MLGKAFICACMAAAAAITVAAQTQTPTPINPPGPPNPLASSAMVSVHTAVPVSADVTLSLVNPGGSEQDQPGRYFRSGDGKIREDSPAGSVITDFKAGTITTLNPTAMQAVMASTPGPKGRYLQTGPPLATPTVTLLGQTTLEGHPVVKRLITLNSSPGQSTEVWTATDIRMTVLLKVTSATGQTTTKQYQNIQVGEPDPSVFTIPQGFTVTKTVNSANMGASVAH